MLLRRVIEHVREQNWTAISIDFVIVVIGVFVGLQVQEWSQGRADRQSERQIVQDLLAVHHVPLDRGHVQGRRQEVANRVQQRLYALVLERGSTQHRDTA